VLYLFEDFELREEDFSLSRSGQRISLEPKSLRVLLLLVSRAGHLVDKQCLMDTVWAGAFVEENNLARVVAVLRRELGDNSRKPRLIETVPTRGYRFIAPVEMRPDSTSPGLSSTENAGREVPAYETASRPPEGADSGSTAAEDPDPAMPYVQRHADGSIRRIAVAAVLMTVLLSAMAGYWWRSGPREHPVSGPEPSIALLPITNETGDSQADYLADGVTETVIRQLSGVPGLRVIGAASVFRYKHDQQDARSLGRSFGVIDIMQGHLRRIDGQLSLAIELSRVDDGEVLLSHQYLAEEGDLRPVQADLVRDTLSSVGTTGGGPLQTGGYLRSLTTSSEAYREFLRGESIMGSTSPAELHEAIRHFERATTLDPDFAWAWAELAQEHVILGIYYENPREHMGTARKSARRALTLNSDIAVAHSALGLIYLLYDWNQAAARSELEPAGSTRSAVSSLACTAHLLSQAGQPRKADEILQNSLAYDPESGTLINELGCVAYYHRRYEDAVTHFKKAMEHDPTSPLPYWGLGRSLTLLGRYQEAFEALNSFSTRNGDSPPVLIAESGYTLARWGKRQDAEARLELLSRLSKSNYINPFFFAVIHLGLGERDQTFQWLSKAADERSTFLISILSDPKWDDLLSDPRTGAIVARMREGPGQEIGKGNGNPSM
jgi:DNA-binding winged helix-turn-helix (wHTH) protein/TolB-like protein/tetratricopeptide (TPR) repeat protein